MGLDLDVQNILELNNRSSSAQSEAFEKLKQLQEKIKGGESTGDTIKDFVIANLGTLSPDAEKPYRETEVRLKNNVGNHVLSVRQSESIHGCPGIIPPSYIDPMFIGLDTELRLGVLTSGLELDIGKGEIIFPTEKYARKFDKYSESEWQLKEGPISFGWYKFMDLGKKIQRKMLSVRSDLSNLPGMHFGSGLMLYLGEEVKQYFGGDRYLDTSYVEALNLLGHESPERFRKKYDEEVYQTRLGVINKLEELTGRESKLNAEIESIYASTKCSGLMMDVNEAKVVSMKSRMKLEKTREEIQGYLKRGIELGMHKENLKIEQKPGMEINVPVYIFGMCEEYNVGFPK